MYGNVLSLIQSSGRALMSTKAHDLEMTTLSLAVKKKKNYILLFNNIVGHRMRVSLSLVFLATLQSSLSFIELIKRTQFK